MSQRLLSLSLDPLRVPSLQTLSYVCFLPSLLLHAAVKRERVVLFLCVGATDFVFVGRFCPHSLALRYMRRVELCLLSFPLIIVVVTFRSISASPLSPHCRFQRLHCPC